MINAELLYNLIKPITKFSIVMGGSRLPIDYENGTILISLVSTNIIGTPIRDISSVIRVGDDYYINQNSLIERHYQIDVYKKNSENILYVEANEEAIKLQEYLKTFDTQEYLKENNLEILPNFGTINYLTEFTEQKFLINRALFEFTLIAKTELKQKIYKIDKIRINNFIAGGQNG